MDQYYQYRSINPLPIVPSYALVQHTSLSIGMRDEGGGVDLFGSLSDFIVQGPFLGSHPDPTQGYY
jgi:hypothetical protein